MKLARREKIIVYAAAATICCFLFIELLILPLFDKKAEIKKEIITKEREIGELAEMSRKYRRLDRMSGNIKKVLATRKKDFTLLSFLVKAAEKASVNVTKTNQSESKTDGKYEELKVDLTLEAITLEQLTNYLYLIEKPDQLVFVKRIRITDNKRKEGYLDSFLTVITFQ